MMTNDDSNSFPRAFEQFLAEQRAYHEGKIREHEDQIRRIKDFDHMLALIRLGKPPAADDVANSQTERVVIADGRRLPPEEATTWNEDKFDIILDITRWVLMFRENPVDHTPLVEADLTNIGGYRMKLLAYMLEHPERIVCPESPPAAYGDYSQEPTAAAVTKTISLFRMALCTPGRTNPYILSRPALERSSRANACVYIMNPDYRYLVIK